MNALVKAVITFISSCYLVLIEFHLVNCLGKEINVTNGGKWGQWADQPVGCPDGMKAVGFALKVEPKQIGDDTALNSIRIICAKSLCRQPPNDNTTAEIQPKHFQDWGDWGRNVYCPNCGYLASFRLKVEPSRGVFIDDTAANDVQFKCKNVDGLEWELAASNGGSWGSWGEWSPTCPYPGICSLQTKVEGWQGPSDDTALNDLKMYCC